MTQENSIWIMIIGFAMLIIIVLLIKNFRLKMEKRYLLDINEKLNHKNYNYRLESNNSATVFLNGKYYVVFNAYSFFQEYSVKAFYTRRMEDCGPENFFLHYYDEQGKEVSIYGTALEKSICVFQIPEKFKNSAFTLYFDEKKDTAEMLSW